MDQKSRLDRIASANHHPLPGPGFDERQLIPVLTIRNPDLMRLVERRLQDLRITCRIDRERRQARLFVRAGDYARSLEIYEELSRIQPDTITRGLRRDYDHVFVLIPFAILVVIIAWVRSRIPAHYWIAVLVSSASAIVAAERLNRLARYSKWQWDLRDMLWTITIVAINVVVWEVIL